MKGPASTARATVVGSGVPKVSVFAWSSSSMQRRFTSPTLSDSGSSTSAPASASANAASPSCRKDDTASSR